MVSPLDPEAEHHLPVERTPRADVLGVVLKFAAKAATRLPQLRLPDDDNVDQPLSGVAARLVHPAINKMVKSFIELPLMHTIITTNH